MNRLRWLDPLVTYLKTDVNLNGHGNPSLIDLGGQNIFVVGDYDGFETVNNFFHGVVITPQTGRVGEAKDCATLLEYDVVIGAMTKNDRNVSTGFQENVVGSETFQTGAYVDGAVFERQVREAILGFNQALKNNLVQHQWRFEPFKLIELMEPYLHNGLVVMRSLYRTRFTY